MRKHLYVWLIAALLSAACSSTENVNDSGPAPGDRDGAPADAAPAEDAGPGDAAGPDTAPDTAPADTGGGGSDGGSSGPDEPDGGPGGVTITGFVLPPEEKFEAREYKAVIRRTSYGVPHITADDPGSAAFGQGYAFAQDHVCTLADQIVRVRGERAMFLGPGNNDRHVDSDFAFLQLDVMRKARLALPKFSPELRDMIRGYAAGFNKYLADTKPADLPAECANQPWVRPVSPYDLTAYYFALGHFASGLQFLNPMAAASPPAPSPSKAPPSIQPGDMKGFPNLRPRLGSNGWAIGRERSASGRGMVLANPHFPWEGELKLHEVHLTVPGKLNAYGVALMGVVGINIGFNENVGWTHTVSSSQRFTLYKLTINPRNPTQYRYGKEWRNMTATRFSIEVKQADGSLAKRERVLYRTHYGPMLNVQPFGWQPQLGLTMRDANDDSSALLEQFYRMASAGSMDEFAGAHEKVHGIPWVNTMAADKEGNVLYMDSTSVPNLSKEGLEAWQKLIKEDGLVGLVYNNGAVLLDGSDPVFEWVTEADSPRPGLVPLSKAPRLRRTDFVFNSNDSHWLSNPAQRLEGFSPLFGLEKTPRDPRTRLNLVMITETREGGVSGADGKFTLDELAGVLAANRGWMEETLRQPVIERCTGLKEVTVAGKAINISSMCDALRNWDGRLHPDSRGALAWREFLGSFEWKDYFDKGKLFSQAFDPAKPESTPSGLAAAGTQDLILINIAKAFQRLEQAKLKPDTPLGEAQHFVKNGKRIPVPGGNGTVEGAFNMMDIGEPMNGTLLPRIPKGKTINGLTGLSDLGYVVGHGSSFVMALEYTDQGPRAKAILTYSQSGDSRSPHFADQTGLFSSRKFRDILFSEAAISADPNLKKLELAGKE
ncbi:MAG: Acyl-homoserine lactone acylase PvdQ [Myxococcota bacterium]|nr:Acyl-homoserine lactone acylase PvdQ [Myxococcota bacterium]